MKGWLGWGGGGTPTKLSIDGKVVTSPSGLALSMNNFFLHKVETLRKSIPAVAGDPLLKLREAMVGRQCRFNISKVSNSDVIKVIKSLRNSTATGTDYVDTRTLKIAAEQVGPVLAHIINLSICTNTFPTMWKHAKVVPLLKSPTADAILPKSYRPVALLPILSKVLEKVVFGQLVKYLEDNNLVHPNLHGSRAAHSTSTALIQLYDKWAEQADNGKLVGVLICDQSAAFDLCDHYLLVEKLKLSGIDDKATAWIWSYLSNRQQSCFVDGQLSPPLALPPCGVPQGSIGGPLLWLCFTCDQPDSVHEHPVVGQDIHRGCGEQNAEQQIPGGKGDCGDLVGYVDDGAYTYAHHDPAILSEVLTRKFNLLEEWISGNRLVINADKTHLLVLGLKKISGKRGAVQIKAGPYMIDPSESEKLLGCNIHQSMKWNLHMRDHSKSVAKLITFRINGLRKIAKNSTYQTRLMIANGAVMSRLVYMISVWGGAPQYLLQGLQVQQLAAARLVCGYGSRFWSRRKLLAQVGWLSIRQLVHFHTVLQAYKIIAGGKPAIIQETISTQHPYLTRNATNERIRFGERFRAESILLGTSFKYRAVKWYNQVPVSVYQGTQQTVKNKLREWVKKNVPMDWG